MVTMLGIGGASSLLSGYALKHGFFRRGLMLCDRCVLNAKCVSLAPGGECQIESQAYDWLHSELISQYDLQGLADELMVGRVAMYLIRIVRAEVYEANVGISSASVAWGKYIDTLDRSLRALLKELALTRSAKMRLEKDDVFVDVDRLLSRLASKSSGDNAKPRKSLPKTLRKTRRVARMVVRRRSSMARLIADWLAEKPWLESCVECVVNDGSVEETS